MQAHGCSWEVASIEGTFHRRWISFLYKYFINTTCINCKGIRSLNICIVTKRRQFNIQGGEKAGKKVDILTI